MLSRFSRSSTVLSGARAGMGRRKVVTPGKRTFADLQESRGTRAWRKIDSEGTEINSVLCASALAACVLSGTDKAESRADFDVREQYELCEMLGDGAFGVVYKAKRKVDGKDVALKVVDRKFTDDDEFEREISALSMISKNGGHPNVCNLYETHDDGKNFYVAMELIKGGELFEHLIQKGPYSEDDAARFLRNFAEGLSFIHSRGLVHGDLKPENLMLSSWNNDHAQLKIVDFGSAVAMYEKGRGNDSPALGGGGGTTAYWPPEAFREGSFPTGASDMFSAGLIVYILLTGTHPFDPKGDATEDDMKAVVEGLDSGISGERMLDAIAFDSRTEGLSRSCVELMKRLMHPNPEKRMTSEEFKRHPWILGLEASWKALADSDHKLEKYWQRQFRGAILKKYAAATAEENASLSGKNLSQIFRSIDINGNGLLDVRETRMALKELGLRSEQISRIFSAVDLNKSGSVDFPEFCKIMHMQFDDGPGVQVKYQDRFRAALVNKFARSQGGEDSLSESRLRKLFDALDLDGNGLLDANEMHIVLQQLGVADDQFSDVMSSVDMDHSGFVDWEEFRTVMQRSLSKATVA